VLVAAMVEAIVIAALLVRQPRERAPTGDGAPSPILDVPRDQVQPTTGEGPALGSDMVSLTPRPAGNRGGSAHAVAGGDLARRNLDGMIAAITQAARNRRSGGVRLSAPIELMVLQGDRVLGSSADGPIVTSAGTHDLELINASLGFRTRRAVTFPAGEITTLTVPVPPGRISVNATPWAEVWIDGRQAGETPLANLEVALGEHELVLRHPDLGEHRQRIVVRADTVARVSTTFDR
jgi:hypothetical protein